MADAVRAGEAQFIEDNCRQITAEKIVNLLCITAAKPSIYMAKVLLTRWDTLNIQFKQIVTKPYDQLTDEVKDILWSLSRHPVAIDSSTRDRMVSSLNYYRQLFIKFRDELEEYLQLTEDVETVGHLISTVGFTFYLKN